MLQCLCTTGNKELQGRHKSPQHREECQSFLQILLLCFFLNPALLHVREELKKQAQSLIDSHHLFNVERTSRHGTPYS